MRHSILWKVSCMLVFVLFCFVWFFLFFFVLATHQGFPPGTLVSSPASLAEAAELEMNSSSSSSSFSFSSSSSRLSDGNSSLHNEGASASQVPQASVEPAGYRSVVWPDSLSEWLVDGSGLQQMLCCLTASTARALLCVANEEFGIQK